MKTDLSRLADALERVVEILDRTQILKPPYRFVTDDTLPDVFEQTNLSQSSDRTKPEIIVEVPREAGINL